MKKNKKGFTLVELLAVIVVLIIIMLIALSAIRTYTKKSKTDALKANSLGYIKAANDLAGLGAIGNRVFKNSLFNELGLENQGLKISGTKPDNALVCFNNYEVVNACLEYNNSKVTYNNGEIQSIKKGKCYQSDFECSVPPLNVFEYTGNYQTFKAPENATYFIELWGAAGSNNSLGGNGAYTSGYISLNKDDTLYIYVGQNPGLSATATYNGGGGCTSYCTAGGGATDVRLVAGDWNNQSSLASRIMVAAGGAGYDDYLSGYKGGAGGTIKGLSGQGDFPTTPGTQISGGISHNNVASRNGTFGIGGYGDRYGGGGSGGYYGGAGGQNSGTGNGGSSGSSYISGHPGCIAIKSDTEISPKDGCSEGTTNINCSIHYSGYKFSNTSMKSGAELMPTHDNLSTMTGNEGNGYAAIYNNYQILTAEDDN